MDDQSIYLQVKDILFVDIETITSHENYDDLSERGKALWNRKAVFYDKLELGEEQTYRQRAGIYAEFSKVIAISVGFFLIDENDKLQFRVTSFSSKTESEILQQFKSLIEDKFNPNTLRLCAHNGKDYDYPYLCRRFLINQIPIPTALNTSGKKPWEIRHLDTMEMWKFGEYKGFTSLETLAYAFGVSSSKSDIDGSQVSNTYYDDDDGFEKVTEYCKNDVIVTAQIYLSMQCYPQLRDDQIIRI